MIYGFKYLLPKNILSQDSFNPLLKKNQQFKKLTQYSTDLAAHFQKVFSNQSLYNTKIINHTKNCIKQLKQSIPQLYFISLFETYQENCTILQQFSNNIQQYVSQLTSSNSSSFINFSGCLLVLQQQIKAYLASESVCGDLSKKYQKQIKNFSYSIQAYKNSFNEAKLIYNMQQKIKRYSGCEQYYKSSKEQYSILQQMADKLNGKKQQIIRTYCNMSQQYDQNEIISNIKLYKFFSYFTRGFCDVIGQKILIIKSQKKLLEQIKPQSFLNMKLVIRNFEEASNKVKYHTLMQALGQFNQYTKEDHKLRISTFMKSFQDSIENQKKFYKIIYQFHVQFFKSLQKYFVNLIREVVSHIDRNKKKYKQYYLQDVNIAINNTRNLLKQAICIIENCIKKVWKRIQRINNILTQRDNHTKLMMYQLKNHIQKLLNLPENLKNPPNSNYDFLAHLIIGFDQKINKTTSKLSIAYNDIIDDFLDGMTEVIAMCNQYRVTEDEQIQRISKIRTIKPQRLKNIIFEDLKKEQLKKKIVFTDENIEKINEFTKMKKPVDIEIKQKQPSPRDVITNIPMSEQINVNNSNLMESSVDGDSSPLKTDKAQKHRQYLLTKITFLQDEDLIKTFSCALADKIILQGKLYITSHRLCFSSNFNAGNVFFGGTFIQIPAKDILTFQKRKNGIFFDNSISLTTVNGQVFFTSFLKRNEAYDIICKLTGKNTDDIFYQDEDEIIDSSRATQQNHQIELQDDLQQSQITERSQKIEMILLKHQYKTLNEVQLNGENLTAYKALKHFILDIEVNINRKKYPSFPWYFKKAVLKHKDIECSQFQPQIDKYLNPSTIKNNTPLLFQKTWSSIFPIANSGIPFMPKSAKTSEKLKLFIISKHKWITQSEIQNSGAPYTDCFKMYMRNSCESNSEGSCKIKTALYFHFIKNTMMKSVIESKSIEESTMQIGNLHDQYKKYLSNLHKKVQESSSKQMNSLKDNIINDEHKQLNQKLEQYEQTIEQLRKQNRQLKQLKDKQKKQYKIIIAILFVLFLISLYFVKQPKQAL